MSLISKIAALSIVFLAATAAVAQEQGELPPVVIQRMIDDATRNVMPKADFGKTLAQIKLNKQRAVAQREAERRRSELIESIRLRREALQMERREALEAAMDVVDFDLEINDPGPIQEIIDLPENYVEIKVYGGDVRAEHWPARMEKAVEVEPKRAERMTPLSEAEIGKLRLAAKGAVKRLQDEVDEARCLFEKTEHTISALNPQFNNLRLLRLKILNGPFADGSFFAKTLEGIRRKQRETSADLEKSS